MKKQEPQEFEALALPQKELPHYLGTHYRVYSDETNFTTVAAPNALEALKASGVEKPFRIQRDIILLHNIVGLNAMTDKVSGMMADNVQPVMSAEAEPQKPALPELAQADAATTENTGETMAASQESGAAN